jgi:hypothetical protein
MLPQAARAAPRESPSGNVAQIISLTFGPSHACSLGERFRIAAERRGQRRVQQTRAAKRRHFHLMFALRCHIARPGLLDPPGKELSQITSTRYSVFGISCLFSTICSVSLPSAEARPFVFINILASFSQNKIT